MKYVFLLATLSLLASCSPARRIGRDLRTKPAYTDHFTGVALYDLGQQRMLVQHNADKLFTPASNTKLLSFYAGLLTLHDSLPALRYAVRGDSLIFWGTGNPLLLHPDLPDTTALAFLRSRSERLFFSAANYEGPRFGPGWAWDDYNDDYSAELVSLPIYGNVVRFTNQSISPNHFVDSTSTVVNTNVSNSVKRLESSNQFKRPVTMRASRQDVPFRWSPTLAAQLLTATLHRPVGVVNQPIPTDARLLRGSSTDSLYKRMLHVSDNQFAEQVLFMISAERRSDKLAPVLELRRMIDSVLRYPATSAKWVDGSGLSRYNLFTPNILIDVLTKIYARVPQQRLFALLPAAGQSGTLRSMAVSDKPYVFAKSGSMSGVYNLSGYVLTRRGKTLLFSIMHNNFTLPVSEMRRRTSDLLKKVHERF
ncbi:D-alanyl-D-alanine carboxypeptidase/D-alanyl-D-alanine-endopeptidase [Spirosoma soli]|uniref:D-alanyl-D-alanine carboxypeptidase/D-alanyl-D-alanine-endopeptidase n=1 Tax=Spirosoma soli TaxID=1770529 RepID=A0ABW5MC11_9BACT